MKTVRKFRHVNGFEKSDDDYIEYHHDKSVVFVLKNGDRVIGKKVDVREFEKLVKEGIWKELESFKIYPDTESHIFRNVI